MDIKLEIPQQEKTKGAFTRLPDLPDNPFCGLLAMRAATYTRPSNAAGTGCGPSSGRWTAATTCLLPSVQRSSPRLWRTDTHRPPTLGCTMMMADSSMAAITYTIGTAAKSRPARASISAGRRGTPT